MSRDHATHEQVLEPKPANAPPQATHDEDARFQHQSLAELGAIQRKSTGLSARQQSLGEIEAMIQRRATGEAEQSADVEDTARAGVSGSGQALPHTVRIQEAFGRHDISGVRAHTGGEAAEAAEALGAEAYATGDDVAFANEPDLHTAAHEAAHTVQQRAGVVAFKGMGPSNDAHEQNADHVADAVVAGKSAEPLLDDMAGPATKGASPRAGGADAVQRKASNQPGKGKKSKKGEPHPGVDASKPGQVLGKILTASQTLTALRKPASKLMHDAQDAKVSDATIADQVARLADPLQAAKDELAEAWPLLREHVSNLILNEGRPEKEVKQTTLHHPGLEEAAYDLKYALAHLLSCTSGIIDARPTTRAMLATANRMISDVMMIQGNLGLAQTTYSDLLALVQLQVKVSTVDLGSGPPRVQILEHVSDMVNSWKETMGNMSDGMQTFIATVDHASIQQAPNGLMKRIWSKALDLASKGATLVSGTPLAAKIGIEAIKRIVAHGDALEAARVQADEESFKQQLRQALDELQIKAKEGPSVHDLVQELDGEFAKIGRANPEDKWKDGDTTVVGAQADFLHELRRQAKEYRANVPTNLQVEQGCLVEFVNANHKARKHSAARSASESSTYMDGHVEVDLTLHDSGRWFLGIPDAATLHCPKSGDIARALMTSNADFNLHDLTTHFVVRVTVDDSARNKLPNETWRHDRTNAVHLDPSKMNTSPRWLQEYWRWLLDACGTSAYELFTRIRKIEGA